MNRGEILKFRPIELKRKGLLKIDLGSGFSRKPGFLRVDADPKCKPDILCDVRDLKPIKTNSVDVLFASHLLEHFYPEETFSILQEWRRVVRPGGYMEIAVPDCGAAWREWGAGRLRDEVLTKTMYGADPKANEFMRHKNFFWDGYLERMLFITGFVDVKSLTKAGTYELRYLAFKAE